jgi:hypothetical protein
MEPHPDHFLFGDLDGDGLVDLLRSNYRVSACQNKGDPPSARKVTYSLSSEGGFTTRQRDGSIAPLEGGGASIQHHHVAGWNNPYPVDDDGMPYCMTSWPAHNRIEQLADLNGDGVTDYVFFRRHDVMVHRGEFWKGTFDGNAQTIVITADDIESDRPNNLFLHDLNADGMADLVALDSHGIRVLLNDGSRFIERIRLPPSQIPFFDETEMKDAMARGEVYPRISFGDMNGNGGDDLVMFAGGRVSYVDLIGGPPGGWMDFPQHKEATAPRPGLLVAVSNGRGVRTTLTHRTTADLSRLAALSGRPWQFQTPQNMPVITRSITRTAVPATEQTVDFEYRDPAYDGFSRTLRGFRFVESTSRGDNSAPGRVQRTWFFYGPNPWSRDDDPLKPALGNPALVEEADVSAGREGIRFCRDHRAPVHFVKKRRTAPISGNDRVSA